jgi:uncharacterized protein YyaL (SSP411 family)
MANRLAAEKSPYLLQHAGNPVDWYPWGDAAFSRAAAEDKPIFLSIGYSTCHWCHVMERESFENGDIAELLNREFVPIKVDREERPDVDRVYMAFVQATTGSGGWPMSVWLTPDLKPFYGGTYFPPTSRWQRPGFVDVLLEIARAWKSERARVAESAESLVDRLRSLEGDTAASEIPGPEALTRTVEQFRASFDARHGGFGGAPKFPRPSELLFLLREHARTGDTGARDIALQTLTAMALGGMRDHVGGGFHRYSVDAEWRVPHFEKMLYDQAQLALAYLEAAQVGGDPFHADVARDTLAYVAREMSDPAGGFYSAEDADSVPPEAAGSPGAHKSEGAFYLWTTSELAALGGDASVVAARFGIEEGGNAPFDPQGEFTGKNLLYVARSFDEVASATGRTPEDVASILDRARLRMFEMRLLRPRPHLDDKVLTAWNGLMIAAFARGARVLRVEPFGDPTLARQLIERATQAARFLKTTMWDASRRTLYRRYRDGESAIPGYAEDYAAAVLGALELFQATGSPEWYAWARELQDRQDALFWDAQGGGWFGTTGADSSVLMRQKEEYDGAEPAASSIAAFNLLTFEHLSADAAMRSRLEATLRAFGPHLDRHGRVVPMMAAALSAWHAGMTQVVIAGDSRAADCGALLDVLARRYLPFAVVLPLEPGSADALSASLPALSAMRPRDGRATAYVCRAFTCREPVTTPDALAEQLP